MGCGVHSTFTPFQSTHPVRGATMTHMGCAHPIEFQSTHPVRGATKWERDGVQGLPVSIHAPREGCDRLSLTITAR